MPTIMTAISVATIVRMSSRLPVRMVTSMNRLQSHTISSPSDTRPMPDTVRTIIFSRMPRVFCHIQKTYFIANRAAKLRLFPRTTKHSGRFLRYSVIGQIKWCRRRWRASSHYAQKMIRGTVPPLCLFYVLADTVYSKKR